MSHSAALFPIGLTPMPWAVATLPSSGDNSSPQTGAVVTPSTPATGSTGGSSSPQTPTTPGGGAAGPPAAGGASSFLKWTLAMVALWFTLTAMHEYGGAAGELAPYLAGLILFGVLYYQGPKALDNLKGGL